MPCLCSSEHHWTIFGHAVRASAEGDSRLTIMSLPPSTSSLSSSKSTCSCTSGSSSVVYSHEPFQIFAEKLRVLLQLHFANAYSDCTVVYRLQGGGFHRVMAADLPNGAVVIRIPRFEHVSLSDEAAVLSFIRNHSKIPVPRVLKVDTSPSNVLGAPYMIQTKVPGDKLCHIYPTMTYEEKRSVVKQVAHLLGQMSRISMSSIGILREGANDGQVVVGPFKDHPSPDERGVHFSNGTTLLSFLTTRFNFYINYELSQNPRAQYVPSFMNAFLEAAQYIAPVPNSRVVLHHSDFHSRNIMVARREGTGEYQVTALLDWDNTMAVPVEMAFSLPSFLWIEKAGDSDGAGEKLKHIERSRELQNLFEDEIVKLIPDFLDVVQSSKMARKLGWFAAYGLHGSHDAAAADRFLESVGVKRVCMQRGKVVMNVINDNG